MGTFIGVGYGVIAGILGALFIIVTWAMAGIARENMLGCLGGFLTFVIIELPIWIGLPFWVGGILLERAPNLTGVQAFLVVYVVALIILLSINAVRKARIVLENILFKR